VLNPVGVGDAEAAEMLGNAGSMMSMATALSAISEAMMAMNCGRPIPPMVAGGLTAVAVVPCIGLTVLSGPDSVKAPG
jgi:hypothetical protein